MEAAAPTPQQGPDPAMVPGSAASVLAEARAARRAEDAAAAALLAAAAEWAGLHGPTGVGDPAYWWEAGESLPLAGAGAPQVASWAVAELAAAVGMTTDAGRRLVGHALELAHRLPRLWDQVQAGRVPAWRARRVAEATLSLTPAAAGFVDRQVAGVAGKVSLAQLDRLILEARVRYDGADRPDPSDPCPTGPDTRRVRIHTDQVSFHGTVHIDADLDLTDALDLDRALTHSAEQLRLAGSDQTLDARRALALGELARNQPTLTLDSADGDLAASAVTVRPTKPARPVTLYLHLAEQALTGHSPVGRCENTHTPIAAETIRAWCAQPDTVVTLTPVLDLTAHLRVDAYELPDRLTEQIDQRDRHCVFPWCTRPARRCDHDHAIPYDPADPARGPTCTCNVAPLCRHHHRLKTHTPWRYRFLEPGVYLWTSPQGYVFLRDPSGTADVTPAGLTPIPGCPDLDSGADPPPV